MFLIGRISRSTLRIPNESFPNSNFTELDNLSDSRDRKNTVLQIHHQQKKEGEFENETALFLIKNFVEVPLSVQQEETSVIEKDTIKKKGKAGKDFFSSPLYWVITVLSILWIVGGIVTVSKFSPQDFSNVFFMSSQGALVIASIVVLPVMMLWGFAQLADRTRELGQIMESMTSAVMHMMEPELESEKRVVSLGHAIRREITLMRAGIDQTVSRAGELEALLKSEIRNLEQVCNENEVRIRLLISELSHEREAFSSHADRVQNEIVYAKDQLTQEFNSIAERINSSAESFTVTLSKNFNIQWDNLVNEFNIVNENIVQTVSEKLVETVQSFDNSRGHFFAELDNRFFRIDQRLESASNAVAERLENSSKKIIETVDGSISEIEKRSSLVNQQLQFSADKVLGDFDLTFRELDRVIVDRSNQSLADFSDQVNILPEVFDAVLLKINGDFSQKTEIMKEQFYLLSEHLKENINKISQRVISSLDELEKRTSNVKSFLVGNVENVLETFKTEFGRVNRDFLKKSDQSLSNLKKQIAKTEEIIISVHSLNDKIESNVLSLLNQLNISNDSIKITLKTLRLNISEIDTELSVIGTNWQKSITCLSENLISSSSNLSDSLQHFNTLSHGTIENISKFSSQFDDYAKVLIDVSMLLNSSNVLLEKKFDMGQSNQITSTIQGCEEIIRSIIQKTEKKMLSSKVSQSLDEATGEIRRGAEESSRLLSEAYQANTESESPASVVQRKQGKGTGRTILEAVSMKKTENSIVPLTNDSSSESLENAEKFLQIMVRDIVLAIKHEDVIHLWQHYCYGRRNISAEQLYTARGQELFTLIKHKYAVDQGFHQAVNRYITDFEKLLGNRDNDTACNYLSSDTGKVYTLLAHASGRIQ